ncbi:MAG TPA: hypothetical protein VFN31_01190 [Candidatus Saccharimonadales bacterium]|nr:hypothetical protein [Candidatus Saccharimonadales bacterium]
MVVGAVNLKSGSAESLCDVQFPRIKDLKEGQRAFLARSATGFVLEEGTISDASPKGSTLIFRHIGEDTKKPLQVITSSQIEEGETLVYTEPSLLEQELILVPVATEAQTEIAQQLGINLINVMRSACNEEGLLIKINDAQAT